MWRGKPAMRTPFKELNLQPSDFTNSGQCFALCSTLTPSLCKLGLLEGSNNSSLLDFVNAKSTDSPSEQYSYASKWTEACQHESDKQLLELTPQTNSTPKTFEEEIGPVEDYVVKNMVLESSPGGQEQDIVLEAHSDTMAETNSSTLTESLRPGELVRKEVAACVEDSFLEVVAATPEKPAFQDSPSHVLDSSSNRCSEQQLHCPKESLRDNRTECVSEDLVQPESNDFLLSSVLWLSPSPGLATDFPTNHVDQGDEIVEDRAIEEREMNSPTLPEKAELGDQALVSHVENVPPTCLTPNPVALESQAAPSPVEDAGRILGCDSETWMSPLAWLEKGVNTSVMLENLRQSLCLPTVLQDAAIGTTPFSACSVGTWFTPPAPQENSTNQSRLGPQSTKEKSASETQHRLWGHHPPDLTTLSRHDLEDNLMNSLVILEVLIRQLQDWKNHLAVPHLKAQDCSTQTDASPPWVPKEPKHLQEGQKIGQALQQTSNIMQSWVLASNELTTLLHLCLLHVEEDKTAVSQESWLAETLISCCFDMLKKLKAKLQSLKTEMEEARHREEVALRGKDVAETVLEAFCAHASQRISQLEKDLKFTGEFRSLLQEAQAHLVGLHTEQGELARHAVSLTSTLEQDWTSMHLDYVAWTDLLSQYQQLAEKLTTKSRQALQDYNVAVEEKQQISRELAQTSTHLEDCKGQIEQLNLEKGRLATDLRAQLQMLADTDRQLKELQNQHAHCTQDLATKDELLCQLTQSNEEQAAQWQKEKMVLKQTRAELEHQQAVFAKELQDLKETLQFADQESQIAHLELGEVECQLKTTLDVLRERSLQCETLKDTVENLKAELASTIAANQEQDLQKTRQYSQELGVLTKQLQSLTLFLQTKLKEAAEPETLSLSTTHALAEEHPLPNGRVSVGSIWTADTSEEPESAPVSLLGSGKSAFTRVASVVSLHPPETPDIEMNLAEMNSKLLELHSLCTLLQESKEEAIGSLERKICALQGRLQAQEEQHQEAQKAKEADIEKLNQALCLRYKNEKELQEVIHKQNEKILEQIDKSGELISLREEMTQLTRSLRRAETETKVLQETLAGQLDPNCEPEATNWIQEKLWLYQEVDKLRMMFLEVKDEKAKLMVKFQSQRNILEENLRRSDAELTKLDEIVQHIYKTLLSIPEVVQSCQKLQGLLEFLS
ncbi:sperm-associated antigen 5 isoform X2 [Cavia porcellus]|uniref:sperm-associated antigen 5 isoform X2 n=1 Tax=Cavia porcellus TaxID=10141 RepID=UPI002FE3C4C8